jgi:transcriptional regulator with XRE-family HTH domain
MDILNRRFFAQKFAYRCLFTREVIEDVQDELSQRGLERFIDPGRFPDERRQDGVVFFLFPRALPGGFGLLHEGEGLALHQLAAFEGSFRKDKAVHIVPVPAGRIQDESVRVGILPGHRGRFQIFQGFFVKNILAVGTAFVFDENLEAHGVAFFFPQIWAILTKFRGESERGALGIFLLTNSAINFIFNEIFRTIEFMGIDHRGFGKRVRSLRKQKRLTLARLSEITRRSVSLLSQIETGRVSPSFSSMRILADALRVPIAQLIGEDEKVEVKDHAILRPSNRKVLTSFGGVQHQLLSRDLGPSFEFVCNELPPGTSTGKDLYTHEGMECGLLLEGELEVQVGEGVYHLRPGDSITLKSSIPHRISNLGKKRAKAVWVNSVPMIFSTR